MDCVVIRHDAFSVHRKLDEIRDGIQARKDYHLTSVEHLATAFPNFSMGLVRGGIVMVAYSLKHHIVMSSRSWPQKIIDVLE